MRSPWEGTKRNERITMTPRMCAIFFPCWGTIVAAFCIVFGHAA